MDKDSQTKLWELERRKLGRVAFTEPAEIMDVVSGTRFLLRTTDIGPGGCFLDALSPLPIASRVRVTIHHRLTTFQAEGQVVYSEPRRGMGIAFDHLNPEQRFSLLRLTQ
jgi:hypothetical protein